MGTSKYRTLFASTMLMTSPEESCRLLSDHIALNYEQDHWEVSDFACSPYSRIVLSSIQLVIISSNEFLHSVDGKSSI